jgi:gliding motility-associated-like protein
VTLETISTVTSSGTYTIVRTWTVSDSCNNSQVFTQTINVTIPNYLQATTIEAQCDIDIDLTVDVTAIINAQFPGIISATGVFTDLNATGALSSDGFFTPLNLINGSYVVRYENNDLTCPRIVDVTIPVDRNVCTVESCVTLVVHNAFSPNGDGVNETFIIDNITNPCYAENTVEIYNRWGIKVFETENYNNNDKVFKGISEGRNTVKQDAELPIGTYFYILKYKTIEGNYASKDGYLYLSR